MKLRLRYATVSSLLLVGVVISGCATTQSQNNDSTSLQSIAPTGQTKTFNITAKKWLFEPLVIRVKIGDKVQLAITSIDVAHGLAIREFGVSAFLSPGRTTNVEFIADKTGSFSFFCNVSCGRGHNNMRGRLIVE